ncbi:uncharacterized protein I303_104006 [Kwoniella dejecticola CBS 10117]|uniref:Uncharacterized protein n=1 Tax=Kwoniella dejecticola CBS 10117 TaxID=1296121 RepID=A0A1A6A8B7_9TREE|nr:uncharacterized protein I303_04024 [Kwoniella dejecticola CBS 10117]OBR86300.1 hypothetical protein I303_04024 [Kwoniella dejecticola CBS 10117]
MIKIVHPHVHSKDECPSRKFSIPVLPNLDVIHLARGAQPETLNPRDVYIHSTCPFLRQSCIRAKKAITRELPYGFFPSDVFAHLEEMLFSGNRRHDDAEYEGEEDDGFGIYFNDSFLSIPDSVRVLRLVWWDEKHLFRIDKYKNRNPDGLGIGILGRRGGRGGSAKRARGGYEDEDWFKGCNYCDQRGCRQEGGTLHSEKAHETVHRLIGQSLSRASRLERLEVYNVGTGREGWLHEDDGAVERGFEKGVKDRRRYDEAKAEVARLRTEWNARMWHQEAKGKAEEAEEGSELSGQRDIRDGRRKTTVKVKVYGPEEYYLKFKERDHIDSQEAEYWESILMPSPELLDLRTRLAEVNERIREHPVHRPELMPKEDLIDMLDEALEDDRRGEIWELEREAFSRSKGGKQSHSGD